MRFPLPKDADLPGDVAERLRTLPPINVYRMIANAPKCLIPWTDMVRGLYESKVPIRYREIAILRQASIAKAPYELHQHRFIAEANGLQIDEIHEISTAKKVVKLTEPENLICEMAEELEKTATCSDELLTKLQEHFDIQELTELIILISFYCAVARILNATRCPIEKDNPLEGADSPN